MILATETESIYRYSKKAIYYIMKPFPRYMIGLESKEWDVIMGGLEAFEAAEWKAIDNKSDWFSRRIRDQIISQVSVDTKKFLLTIETMMQILPLLGLLGTVVGMIKVFDVMTFFGTGNARLMASGVSQATIPTMAGLVAAISGLYIANLLKRKADDEVSRVADQLVIE